MMKVQTISQVEEIISEILEWSISSGEKFKRNDPPFNNMVLFFSKSKKWRIHEDSLLDLLNHPMWDKFLFPHGILGTGKSRTEKLCELLNEKEELKRFLKLRSFR